MLPMSNPIATDLFHILNARLEDEPRQWLQEVGEAIEQEFDYTDLIRVFSSATRKLGKAPVYPTDEELERFSQYGPLFTPGLWGADEMARAYFLVKAIDRIAPDQQLEMLDELYYKGDSRERHAILRSLILLPGSSRFWKLGADACRTSVQTVFESIACENPYPAAHFPDLIFNQMVLKALFTGLPLERIVDWKIRNNDELARMTTDYADERQAANRTVPPDIQKIIDHSRSGK
jgi:hypothetical protein